MQILEKVSEWEWTYKAVEYLCFEGLSIDECDFGSDETVNIFLPSGLKHDPTLLFLIGLVVVEGVYELLIGGAVHDLINPAVKGVIFDL